MVSYRHFDYGIIEGFLSVKGKEDLRSLHIISKGGSSSYKRQHTAARPLYFISAETTTGDEVWLYPHTQYEVGVAGRQAVGARHNVKSVYLCACVKCVTRQRASMLRGRPDRVVVVLAVVGRSASSLASIGFVWQSGIRAQKRGVIGHNSLHY